MALAAAHSLDLMHDNSAYEVYYEILNGERKAGKGLIASQTSMLRDPKKMAEFGFEEGIGFIPFAGIGWGAIKAIRKDDSSPVRAAAARVLARDPDPATTKALTDATGDNSWIVQAAALEALGERGDPSALPTVEKYMSDEKGAIKFTAAAAVVHLTAIKQAGAPKHEELSTTSNRNQMRDTLRECGDSVSAGTSNIRMSSTPCIISANSLNFFGGFAVRRGRMATIELAINGRPCTVEADPQTSLLTVLREHLDLTGTKYGCGEGQCGACTVLVDGSAQRSCVTRVSTLRKSTSPPLKV